MKKSEVLGTVKEEIRMASRVFEDHCKDENVTERQLKTYLDYAKGKLTACVNIWISLEMDFLTEDGRAGENLKRAEEIRKCEYDIEDNLIEMYFKKLEELKS